MTEDAVYIFFPDSYKVISNNSKFRKS